MFSGIIGLFTLGAFISLLFILTIFGLICLFFLPFAIVNRLFPDPYSKPFRDNFLGIGDKFPFLYKILIWDLSFSFANKDYSNYTDEELKKFKKIREFLFKLIFRFNVIIYPIFMVFTLFISSLFR